MLGFDMKTARYTWTAALVLLLIYLVYLVRQTLFVFTIALMFAYLLYPLFDWIDRRTGSRARMQALAITYILVIAAIAGFGFFIGSHLSGEAAQLAAQIREPDFEQKVRSWQVFHIPVGQQIFTQYQENVGAIPSIIFKVMAAFSNVVYIVVIPILSFFILKDGRQIRDSLLELTGNSREAALDTLNDAHTLMLQYMRALLSLCLATLIVFSIALQTMGVPYAILLASIAFPLEFIPLVGPLGAAAVITAVTLFTGGHVVGVVIFLVVYRMFQDYVLSPHLMSKGVELHPVMVMFGVFAGGEIGGVQGIFLSVPVLALVRLLYYSLRKRHVIAPRQVVTA
jgi:predicted PurR-regulated permease PerM